MISTMIRDALSITYGYLRQSFSAGDLKCIELELRKIVGDDIPSLPDSRGGCSYDTVQELLSSVNEKGLSRKSKGVYYTPHDVADFILAHCARLAYGRLTPDAFHTAHPEGFPYRSFCFKKTVYDPTCGAGEFLLAALNMKLDLLELHHARPTRAALHKLVATIHGNDENPDSIIMTKLRLLLCILHRFGVSAAKGLADRMSPCFECRDYVTQPPEPGVTYDVIVGNPPYVEDAKSGLAPPHKYGNIYANVVEHAAMSLKAGGVLGFVVPLSYLSTPRMGKLRRVLAGYIPTQYLLSYSDRPDCLFPGVHQKLCLLLGKSGGRQAVYTANYRYWYKEERPRLFETAEIVKNSWLCQDYIPKLGTPFDVAIFQKVSRQPHRLFDLLQGEGTPVYLNMRAAFWIKAFLRPHDGSEYKAFSCRDEDHANYCMCLLNSSLFWWYWICVSDCWHITQKELCGFRAPRADEFGPLARLAEDLERGLEATKLYVGTRQTQYEYKHKDCVAQIHAIDDLVNRLYGLTGEESQYIKDFAFRYRIGGGDKR